MKICSAHVIFTIRKTPFQGCVTLNHYSSICVYTPGSPFQSTPTPSPLRGGGGGSRSLKRQAGGVYVKGQEIKLSDDLEMTLTFSNI